MLCDNFELQEAIIENVNEKANKLLELFPDNEKEKGRARLTDLAKRQSAVAEQLGQRREEMLWNSVDWREFEVGLQSCQDWLQRADERISEIQRVPDEHPVEGHLQVRC